MISACSVCSQHFFAERLLEVDEQVLVEFQITHGLSMWLLFSYANFGGRNGSEGEPPLEREAEVVGIYR